MVVIITPMKKTYLWKKTRGNSKFYWLNNINHIKWLVLNNSRPASLPLEFPNSFWCLIAILSQFFELLLDCQFVSFKPAVSIYSPVPLHNICSVFAILTVHKMSTTISGIAWHNESHPLLFCCSNIFTIFSWIWLSQDQFILHQASGQSLENSISPYIGINITAIIIYLLTVNI